MFEERPGPGAALPWEILALLTRLDDRYAASLQRPEPIAPLSDQEPIARTNLHHYARQAI